MATGAPSFKEISQLDPFDVDLSELPKYGLARHDATTSLGKRLSQFIEDFQFKNYPPSTIITYVEVIRFGITALALAGFTSDERHHSARLFILRSKVFLMSTSLGIREKQRMSAIVDDVIVRLAVLRLSSSYLHRTTH